MQLITDPDILAGYLTDASNTTGHASGLLRPRSAEEVAEALHRARRAGEPVTVTARRTATTGGPVPKGGWLLSTELLNRIHAPDHAEAGALLGDVQRASEAKGWLFPPDPTSRNECSLGAAISCNASGARSFRYGATRPWVEWVQAVLPTGEIIEADRSTPIPPGWPVPRWSEPRVKTAAGYPPADNLLDLLIGQEGTLAVITEARLRLVRSPPAVLSLLAFFPDTASLVSFVDAARARADRARRPLRTPGPLNPRAIEYYDARALQMVRERVPDVPAEATGALFLEIEHDGEAPLEAWWDALEEQGALADDTIVAESEAGRRRLHAVRHAVPAGVNERLIANGMPKIGTDFAVPDEALADILRHYEAVTLPSVCFGHIGDNHLHLNLLPRNPAELEQARRLYGQLARRAVSLGGTVSAEHGIGKIKRGLLAEMVGEDILADMRALKAAVDPDWTLGRGTLFDKAS